ncbi:hypothetical protein KIW84_056955 [Lathyrus oleraceus]|uniref:Uncharacterized protein n=1 Tax=Pisum sativum TaxID=3888 RepID=A0A9D5AKD8_PEA|nr:hypothetical protein KIW84_056955 [Pisum sativum]
MSQSQHTSLSVPADIVVTSQVPNQVATSISNSQFDASSLNEVLTHTVEARLASFHSTSSQDIIPLVTNSYLMIPRAIQSEYASLIKNETKVLTTLPPHRNALAADGSRSPETLSPMSQSQHTSLSVPTDIVVTSQVPNQVATSISNSQFDASSLNEVLTHTVEARLASFHSTSSQDIIPLVTNSYPMIPRVEARLASFHSTSSQDIIPLVTNSYPMIPRGSYTNLLTQDSLPQLEHHDLNRSRSPKTLSPMSQSQHTSLLVPADIVVTSQVPDQVATSISNFQFDASSPYEVLTHTVEARLASFHSTSSQDIIPLVTNSYPMIPRGKQET